MRIQTYKLHYGGKLMPWAKGTVVENPRGLVFLAGSEGRHPDTDIVVEGAEAQTTLCLEKIKERLGEMGTSLDNIVKMTTYIAGRFPDGVAHSPLCVAVRKAKNDFFRKHAPRLCEDNNPPPEDLIGVPALARKEMVVEISVIAALPDL